MKKITLLLIVLHAGFVVFAQSEKEKGLETITNDAIKGQLEFLASDWTEGRAVGTKGAYLAADYIASMFKTYGIKPLGDERMTRPTRSERMAGKRPEKYNSYFQNFSLIQYEPGETQTLSVLASNEGSESAIDFAYKTDFYVRTSTVGQSAKAPLVFVGYAYKNEKEGYNDLKKIDLKGKIAVILAGYPGHKDTASVGYKNFKPEGRYASYYLERDKITRLKEAGAVAVVRINFDSDPMISWADNDIYDEIGGINEADKMSNPFYQTRMSMPGKELNASLPSFTVSARVANQIFANTNFNIGSFEENAANKLESNSQALEGKSIAFKTTVKSKVVKARNVIGYIEGEKKDEFIVVGAHYDHLGMHDGIVYNGADDNASGTVGVMTIARAFKATGKKPKRSVIFAAWTGEEKGLLGSRYFVKDAVEKEKNIVLKLNYDMIARDSERDTLKNQAWMVYTKANAGIATATKNHLENFDINLDLDLRPSQRPRGGSDHAPFAQEDIPIFYFMAAMHPDYHQPGDELSKINWNKMKDIIKIGFLNTWEFANTDDWMSE